MAKKEKGSVNEPTREVLDLRDQGGIDIRTSVGDEGPVPITGSVGVMVLGKDPERSAIMADVIHNQLQKLGLPMVERHEFHEVGRSHTIEYNEPSVMDIIGRRDPKLYGTAVVVAHDNIGHKLVGAKESKDLGAMLTRQDLVGSNETKVSRIGPIEESAETRRLFGGDGLNDRKISDIADKVHNEISEAVTNALINGVYDLEPNVAPVNRLFAIQAFVSRAGVGAAAYDGYRRIENMVMAAEAVENHIDERVDSGMPALSPDAVEHQLLSNWRMENRISHPNPTDEDRDINEQVEEELVGMFGSYLGIHQDDTMRRAKGEFPYNSNPQVGTNGAELERILEQARLPPDAKQRIYSAIESEMRGNNPSATTRTYAPGQGFNRDLTKLEGIVEELGRMNQKRIDPAKILEKHLQNPRESSEEENRWAQGVVDRVNNMRAKLDPMDIDDDYNVVDTRPGGKDDPEVILERVKQRMNESNANAADTIEDLLTDASELPRDVTVQANGVRLTNDSEKGAVVKFLKNGITVGRF